MNLGSLVHCCLPSVVYRLPPSFPLPCPAWLEAQQSEPNACSPGRSICCDPRSPSLQQNLQWMLWSAELVFGWRHLWEDPVGCGSSFLRSESWWEELAWSGGRGGFRHCIASDGHVFGCNETVWHQYWTGKRVCLGAAGCGCGQLPCWDGGSLWCAGGWSCVWPLVVSPGEIWGHSFYFLSVFHLTCLCPSLAHLQSTGIPLWQQNCHFAGEEVGEEETGTSSSLEPATLGQCWVSPQWKPGMLAALPTVTPPSLHSPASAAGTWASQPAEALHSEGPWRKCFQHWFPSFQTSWSHEQEGWSYQKNSSTRHLFCLLFHSAAQQCWCIYSGKDDLLGKDERDAPLSPCCSLSWTGWLADAGRPGPFEWMTLWAWWLEKKWMLEFDELLFC